MHPSVSKHLNSVAAELLIGNVSKPSPISEQRALQILEILKDGEWHTASEISNQIGISRKYVADILRACKTPWNLESATSRYKGWKLAKIQQEN
jgi:GTP-sensing pleiotropic transcriptional regulator CodY